MILIALAAAAGGSSDPASIAENLQAVSGPPGDKYTFEQLQEAFAAAADGEDIDYEGASGPIDFDDAGDPSSASYGTWSYTERQARRDRRGHRPRHASRRLARGRLRPSPRRRPSEVELGHLGVAEERVAGALEAVLAVLEHVAAVGDPEGAAGVLLDHHDRHARAVDVGHGLEHLAHRARGEPRRGLVEQQHRRVGHQGAGHGEHLALASGERARALPTALAEAGEEGHHPVHALPGLAAAQHPAHLQVLQDGERREDVAHLGDVAHALGGDLVGVRAGDVLPAQDHPALAQPHEAEDGLGEGRLAGAVGADHDDDLPLRGGEVQPRRMSTSGT